MIMRASRLAIHCEPELEAEIDTPRIHKFAEECVGIQVDLYKDRLFDDADIEHARIYDIKRPLQSAETPCGKTGSPQNSPGNYGMQDACSVPPPIYDGFEVCKTAAERVCSTEKSTGGDTLDIIFTNALVCTFGYDNYRYHARMLVGANPFLISIPGMVEAPARSKEYHVRNLMRVLAAGESGCGRETESGCRVTKEPVKRGEHAEGQYDYITRNDPRIPDIAEGCILQAIAYYETGDAFCTDRTCRMYNAHWQSELINTQVTEPRFCEKHQKIIKRMQAHRPGH